MTQRNDVPFITAIYKLNMRAISRDIIATKTIVILAW